MAPSPAHRFGQVVGDTLQAGILPLLEEFARNHGLYLDKQGSRPCRPNKKKCAWTDLNGNVHDLDFVLERGGSPDTVGVPVAFIEVAWRRYTKHSRNKVQEIQGAVEPLAQTFRNAAPFKGAVLAGVFTLGALTQLRSLGFTVLHIPYEAVVAVFGRFGVDASSTEATPDSEFQRKVDSFQSLSLAKKTRLAAQLIQAQPHSAEQFIATLTTAVTRRIERVVVLVLHGESREHTTVEQAIRFIRKYRADAKRRPVERFEIEVRYSNGDVIRGSFKDQEAAIDFLRAYEPLKP